MDRKRWLVAETDRKCDGATLRQKEWINKMTERQVQRAVRDMHEADELIARERAARG